jgi:monoamine oxidase
LPQALHQRLSARVELNRPVTRVEQARPGVYRVASQPGSRVEFADFDVVAVALPNYWLPRIEWGGQRLADAMHRHHAYYDRPGHYLRIAILFRRPFWRALIADPYFLLDAFGGCCVYDEGTRSDTGGYGVLSWLLSGSDALVMSNLEDEQLVARALTTLPRSLAAGRELFVEGRVHRWVGAVSAQPGGYPVREVRLRHLPDPQEHPGLFVVGDYLFDSTINGVLHSANTVAGLIGGYLRRSLTLPGKKARVAGRFAGATGPADAARPPVRR